MSSFLSHSSRRRFSPPEKPQPRFEWRMRVHSLMMDERENVDSLSERRAQRYESGRQGLNDSVNDKHEPDNKVSKTDESHEHRRRSRFLRTQSEGYLKVRLRLSKFSDMSKSQDDAESLSAALDESRHTMDDKSISVTDFDPTKKGLSQIKYHTKTSMKGRRTYSDEANEQLSYVPDNYKAANNEQYESSEFKDVRALTDQVEAVDISSALKAPRRISDSNTECTSGDIQSSQDLEKTFNGPEFVQAGCYVPKDSQNGFNDEQGAQGELVDYQGENYKEKNLDARADISEKDIRLKLNCSQGAIPKRYSNTFSLNHNACIDPFRSPENEVIKENNVKEDKVKEDKVKDITEENQLKEKINDSTSCNESCIKLSSGKFHAVDDITVSANDNNTTKQSDCKQPMAEDVSHLIEENELIIEDCSNSFSKSSSEDKGDMDDIESIIEQIIAEEEAILDGKEPSAQFIEEAIKHINRDAISTLRKQYQTLQDSLNTCKDEEEEKGVNIVKSTSQNDQKSSSLPPYCSSDEQKGVTSVMRYSSSCPYPQDTPDQKKARKKEEEDQGKDFDSWAYLPVILIEDIFTLLTPKERHQASQVCRQWYDLFYSPRVWETFILLERTLTKKRFNLYKGYQRELCPGKTQLCFRRVGSFFKRIIVTPISDYFNLYEFLRILAAFLQFQEDHGQTAMPLLHTFDFTFACASRSEGVEMVHGTGGQILEMIIQLLVRMNTLKHLKLNQLLVDVVDVPSLFDAIVSCFGESLSSLELLNVTKVPLPLTDLSRFRNLVKLTVSPQHLNDEVILLISGLNIMHLHLLQDPYTCECEPVSNEAWKLVREIAPWLKVYLEVIGITRSKVLIQPRAPVHGVFLRTPYSKLTNDLVMSLVECYSKTLRYFVQERLPRTHGPRGFNHRSDSSLLFLVRRCTLLHTLVIRERISTSTLILLANEGSRLSTLLVRKNGLIKRCDWPQCGEMSKEFYANLKTASLDYGKCTDEICKLLKRRWKPLEDRMFMRLKIVPKLQII